MLGALVKLFTFCKCKVGIRCFLFQKLKIWNTMNTKTNLIENLLCEFLKT